jgi:hypothetical protein
MCDCSKLKLVSDHDPQACPVTAALFCSICQIYGHPTMKCPDLDTWHYRKPEFVEQLIPSSLLDHYKIKSLTPMNPEVKTHPPYIHGDPIIEIPNDSEGKNIRATLSSYNLPCASVKENKRVLEEFGNLIGKRILYTHSSKKKHLN